MKNTNCYFCSTLPPNENGMWEEEEVKRAAERVTEFYAK